MRFPNKRAKIFSSESLSFLRKILPPFLGSGILSSTIAYHLATNNLELVDGYTKWFLERHTFKFLLFLGTFLIGTIFLTAGRRGYYLSWLINKYSGSIASFYSSSCGSIIGWIAGVCIAATVSDFSRYWLLTLAIMIISNFSLLTPIF